MQTLGTQRTGVVSPNAALGSYGESTPLSLSEIKSQIEGFPSFWQTRHRGKAAKFAERMRAIASDSGVRDSFESTTLDVLKSKSRVTTTVGPVFDRLIKFRDSRHQLPHSRYGPALTEAATKLEQLIAQQSNDDSNNDGDTELAGFEISNSMIIGGGLLATAAGLYFLS